MVSTSLYNCHSHLCIISVMTGIFVSKLVTMFQLKFAIYSMSIFFYHFDTVSKSFMCSNGVGFNIIISSPVHHTYSP